MVEDKKNSIEKHVDNLFYNVFGEVKIKSYEDLFEISKGVVFNYILPNCLHNSDIKSVFKFWEDFSNELNEKNSIEEKRNIVIKFVNFLKEWITFDFFERDVLGRNMNILYKDQ